MNGYEQDWAGTSWKVKNCQGSCGLQVNDELIFGSNGAAITRHWVDPVTQSLLSESWGDSCTYDNDHLAHVTLGSTQYDIVRNQGELTCNLSASALNPQPTGGASTAKVRFVYAQRGNYGGVRLFRGLKSIAKSVLRFDYPGTNESPNADDPPTVWTAQSGSTGGSGGGAPVRPKPRPVTA